MSYVVATRPLDGVALNRIEDPAEPKQVQPRGPNTRTHKRTQLFCLQPSSSEAPSRQNANEQRHGNPPRPKMPPKRPPNNVHTRTTTPPSPPLRPPSPHPPPPTPLPPPLPSGPCLVPPGQNGLRHHIEKGCFSFWVDIKCVCGEGCQSGSSARAPWAGVSARRTTGRRRTPPRHMHALALIGSCFHDLYEALAMPSIGLLKGSYRAVGGRVGRGGVVVSLRLAFLPSPMLFPSPHTSYNAHRAVVLLGGHYCRAPNSISAAEAAGSNTSRWIARPASSAVPPCSFFIAMHPPELQKCAQSAHQLSQCSGGAAAALCQSNCGAAVVLRRHCASAAVVLRQHCLLYLSKSPHWHWILLTHLLYISRALDAEEFTILLPAFLPCHKKMGGQSDIPCRASCKLATAGYCSKHDLLNSRFPRISCFGPAALRVCFYLCRCRFPPWPLHSVATFWYG
jgi:hypothetical protein